MRKEKNSKKYGYWSIGGVLVLFSMFLLYGLFSSVRGYMPSKEYENTSPQEARETLLDHGYTEKEIDLFGSYIIADKAEEYQVKMGDVESQNGLWSGSNPSAKMYLGHVWPNAQGKPKLTEDSILTLEASTHTDELYLGGVTTKQETAETWLKISRPILDESLIGETVSIVYELKVTYPVQSGVSTYTKVTDEKVQIGSGMLVVTEHDLNLFKLVRAAEKPISMDWSVIAVIATPLIVGLALILIGFRVSKQ